MYINLLAAQKDSMTFLIQEKKKKRAVETLKGESWQQLNTGLEAQGMSGLSLSLVLSNSS